jgi:hypothetical protein
LAKVKAMRTAPRSGRPRAARPAEPAKRKTAPNSD